MLFITTRPCPLTSAGIFSVLDVRTPVHYRCNPAGTVLVISNIWRCDGREILPHYADEDPSPDSIEPRSGE